MSPCDASYMQVAEGLLSKLSSDQKGHFDAARSGRRVALPPQFLRAMLVSLRTVVHFAARRCKSSSMEYCHLVFSGDGVYAALDQQLRPPQPR
jgi:hypothetical protein